MIRNPGVPGLQRPRERGTPSGSLVPRAVLTAVLIAVTLVLPTAGRAASGALNVLLPEGRTHQLATSSGMIDLSSVLEVFGLRSSLDLLGDRLDLVGEGGSCRLLLGSPLLMSRGLFSVMSGPFVTLEGRPAAPMDFLTRALPALTGRSATLDQQALVMGKPGSGQFQGKGPEDLLRTASFIRRDQYVPEEILKEKPRGLSVVVLDPGHGGRSPGARGSTGTLEKDLVLTVAEKLKTRLEEGLGIKVVLTRTADYFVGLKERTAIGNNNRADLFLSIHANATFRRDIEGYETYYLSMKTADMESRQYAEMENRALGVKGGENEKALLEAILWDLAQTEFLTQSARLASIVQGSLVRDLRGSDRGVRQAPLAVLMGARMPAALVEIGYISNPEQEIRLNRDAYQEQIARSLFRAIEEYHRKLVRGEMETQDR